LGQLQRRQARSLENLQLVEWRVKTESSIGLPLLQVRLPAKWKSVKGTQRTNHVQKCASILPLEDKLLKK
jgi:hypothetical protein